MVAVRLLTLRELNEGIEDVDYEIMDLYEEISVHEQYKPMVNAGYDCYEGTPQQWSDTWTKLKADIVRMEAHRDALIREAQRRMMIHETRTAVAQSAIYSKRQHIVFLEDIFWQLKHKTIAVQRG